MAIVAHLVHEIISQLHLLSFEDNNIQTKDVVTMSNKPTIILGSIFTILLVAVLGIYSFYYMPSMRHFLVPYPKNHLIDPDYKDNSTAMLPVDPSIQGNGENNYTRYTVHKDGTASVNHVVDTPDDENSSVYNVFIHNYVKVDGQIGDTTEIKPYTFTNHKLSSVILNSDLQVIDSHAFENSQIGDIQFNENLHEIKPYAFHHTNLTTVEIPKSVQIDDNAFDKGVKIITVQ